MKSGKREGVVEQIEEMAQEAKNYSDLQLYLFKLKMSETLSLLLSKFIFAVTLFIVVVAALIFALSAASHYIGELLNSEGAGALIVAALLLLLSIIIYIRRGKFFLNSIVKTVSSTILESEDKSN